MLQLFNTRASIALIAGVVLYSTVQEVHAQFGPAQALLPGQQFPALDALDLDNDGDLDLVGYFGEQQFRWAQNTDGQGTLAGFDLILDAAQANSHAFGDMDGDGLLDLVFVDAVNAVRLAVNTGAGNFATPILVQDLATPAGKLALADLSNNGSLEIIITLSVDGTSRLAVIPNESGIFAPMYLLPQEIPGVPPTILLAGDLNNSGGMDILFITEGDAAIGLLNMNGIGTEWQEMSLFNLFNYQFIDPILIDVDGDDDLDVAEAHSVVVQWAENRLSENIPFNAFTVRVIEPMMTAGIGAFANLGCGEGASVVYIPSDPQLPVRWSTYLPSIQRFAPRMDLPNVIRGTTLLLADMNGDGKADLLIGNDTGLFLYNNEIVPPTTVVEAPAMDTVCVSGPSIPLPDGTPAGGTWVGTWVSDNIFHRASVGTTSTVPLAYIWQEPEGCPVGDATTIRVIAGPQIDPFIGPIVCSHEGPFQITSTPQATEWFGLSDGNILDLDQYNGEQIVASYTDVTGATCVSFMGPLNVWNSVPTGIIPAGPFCVSAGMQTIVPEVSWENSVWGGDIAGTEGQNALFDPSQGAGTYTITLSRQPMGPQQCANSDSITIVVSDDAPEITMIQPETYCASTSSIDLTLFAEPDGGVWSGPGVSGELLLPFIAGPGTHELTYTFGELEGCSTSEQISLTLASSATISHAGGDQLSFCIDEAPITFIAQPEGGEWSGAVTAAGVFDPAAAGVGEHSVSYVYTDPNGCMLVNAPTTLTVSEEPTEISINAPATLCLVDPPIEITGSPAGIWSGAIEGIGSSILFDPQALGVGTWTISLTAEAEGFCPATTSVDVQVEICTDVPSIDITHWVSIAPNPTTGISMIHLNASGTVQLMVFDAAGRKVLDIPQITAQGPVTVPLDLTSLANGVYHLHVMQGEQLMQLKVLKAGH